MAVFVSPKTDFRSDGEQGEERAMITLSEAPQEHLLATPPSHFGPQKVKGLVFRFT
jgi:hypothetical protein